MSELIPAGVYKAKCVAAEMAESSKANPQCVQKFEIVEGDYVGRQVTYFGVMSEKTKDWVLKGMLLCGWDGESETLDGIDRNEVEIEIEVDTYNGKTNNKVRWVVDPSRGLAKKPMSADKKAAFFGSMKGRVELLKQAQSNEPGADDFDPNTL